MTLTCYTHGEDVHVTEDDPSHGQEADAVDTGETAGRLTGGQQLGPVGVDRERHQHLDAGTCRTDKSKTRKKFQMNAF